MKFWIARDKDGGLYLYNYEPPKNKISGRFTCCIKPDGEWSEEYELNSQLFPEVTFENSPQEVEIKLRNEIVGIAESSLKTFPRLNEFEVGASYRR
jgi:hypothetical protein